MQESSAVLNHHTPFTVPILHTRASASGSRISERLWGGPKLRRSIQSETTVWGYREELVRVLGQCRPNICASRCPSEACLRRLEGDGSASEDLAPLAGESDEKCMAQYMPAIGDELEYNPPSNEFPFDHALSTLRFVLRA